MGEGKQRKMRDGKWQGRGWKVLRADIGGRRGTGEGMGGTGG